MTINDVLIFDTETTGIPGRSAQWETDYMDFPHIVSIAWVNQFKQESHIIRPDGWEIPEDTVAVHGITTEYAKEHGEPFAIVIDKFIEDCLETPLICAHNIHFDTSIVKANILRELGREYYDANRVEDALFKGKRIDTMRSAMAWVDARMANGRVKFPRLEELYSRCFPGESFPAHDALEDVKAVARCLPVLVERGIVELKVKEYPEPVVDAESAEKKINQLMGNIPCEKEPIAKTHGNGPNFDLNKENDNLPVQQTETRENANSGKITGVAAALLEQNDF